MEHASLAIQSAMKRLHISETSRPTSQPEPGCWCNGEGGRYPHFDEIGNPTWFSKYCTCSAGIAAKEEAERNAPMARQRRVSTWRRSSRIPGNLRTYEMNDCPFPGVQKRLESNPSGSCYLWGEYGRGKSTLAASYLLWWIGEKDREAIFTSMPELLSELRRTFDGQGSEYDLVEYYGSRPLLVLDDVGAESIGGTGWVDDVVYRLICRRLGQSLPTVFTSNIDLIDMAERLGERICQRILELCGREGILKIDGPNRRFVK